MVGMRQMTHLMRDNILNAGARRLDEFRIQNDFSLGVQLPQRFSIS